VALASAPDTLVSIIVPVFNEAATVTAVVERLLTINFSVPREILVINDGSTDGTRAALERMTPNAAVQIVHIERNRGKGYAVRQGFVRARGSVIAIQDADLELDPAQLPDLVGPVLRGEAEVVYGSRFLRSTSAPFMTVAGNRLLTGLTNVLFGSSLTDMETCYKVMRGDVARSLVLSADRFDIEPEITARLLLKGYRIVERPVRFDARSRMAGKKIRWRDGWMALRVLLAERLRGR
jgi:glycosyltransferase involved in cell wall biosynthesis